MDNPTDTTRLPDEGDRFELQGGLRIQIGKPPKRGPIPKTGITDPVKKAKRMRDVRLRGAEPATPRPMQLQFAKHLAMGFNKTEAAHLAGYRNPPQTAALERPSMQAALAAYGIALDQLDERLGEIVQDRDQDPNTALKAIDIGYKRNGAYVTRVESKNLNVNANIYDEIAERLNRELYGVTPDDQGDE